MNARSTFTSAATAMVAFLCSIGCQHDNCVTFAQRKEGLSVGTFECGDSLYSISEETVGVIECISTRKESCQAAVGTIANDVGEIYALAVNEHCRIVVLYSKSPGEPDVAFTERTCADFTPTEMHPGFAVQNCGKEEMFPSCEQP